MSETALLTPTDDVLYGTSIEDALYPRPVADKLMELVDALLAAIAEAKKICWFSWPFDALWQDDALAALDDDALAASPLVWIVDGAEIQHPAKGGSAIEEFQLLIVIQRKLTHLDDRPAECRKLSTLASEIMQFCRQTCVADATCVATSRNPARNLKDYSENNLFYCEIHTTWHRMYNDG